MELEELLVKAGKECETKITANMINQFESYYNLLIEWNEKINLTAITQKDEVYVKHFIDCVYLAQYLKQNASVCDIGTGAGFPGIVLKIIRPDIKLYLVDSLNKRINFLQIVCDNLGLTDVKCIHARAEDVLFKNQYLNTFDYVVARAVARLNTLTEYCLPYVKVGGQFLAMKSVKADEELKEASSAIKILGGKFNCIENYILNNEMQSQQDAKNNSGVVNNVFIQLRENEFCNALATDAITLGRSIIVINKINNTNSKYPRGQNKPRTSPLK